MAQRNSPGHVPLERPPSILATVIIWLVLQATTVSWGNGVGEMRSFPFYTHKQSQFELSRLSSLK